MREKDLLKRFMDALQEKESNKKELVYKIADILHIERESAYRRLSGKVHFTVREMGILANEMDISIDSLLNEDSDKTSVVFKMDLISAFTSIELLENILNEFSASQQQVGVKDAEVGCIVNTLPVEFFYSYPNLNKFMCFKWGRNHAGGKEFDDFTSWKVPLNLLKAQDRYVKCFSKYKSIFYIWDNPLIWNLVTEIKYHRLINVVSPEDVKLLKEDLHSLLNDMEDLLTGNNKLNPYNIELDFYITNFSISTTAYYLLAGNNYLSSIWNTFLHTVIHHDYRIGRKIEQWIKSLKRFSSLISGSGERDRKIFFREQHDIIDTI